MARSQALGYQRNAPNGVAGGSKRPSAYDRFPSGARNMWLNELQAKIEGAFNPPVSPGPSRSPSPMEEDTYPLGVAQDEEVALAGPSSQGMSVSEDDLEEDEEEEEEEEEESVEGEDDQEEADYDEEHDYEEDEPGVPLAAGRPASMMTSQEEPYEDEEEEEDYEEDEEDEGIEDIQQPLPPATQYPRLEDEGLFAEGMLDPRLAEGAQWGEDQPGFAVNEGLEEDANAAQPLFYPHDSEGEEEDDVMFVGDTDEEDDFEEDEEDVEEDELDDDGMGGEDLEPASAPNEASTAQNFEQDERYNDSQPDDAIAVGVEDGQTTYAPPVTMAPGDMFVGQYPGPQGDMYTDFAPSSTMAFDVGPPTDSVYPALPLFGNPSTLPRTASTDENSSDTLYPALPSLPQVQFDNDLIDPSLLADFAQRVEAQASGSLGGTTESQNTSEMTALADAVVSNYKEDEEILAQEVKESSFQHGMGENEQDGYEEDHESQSEKDDEDEPQVQAAVEEAEASVESASSESEGSDGSDDSESDSDEDDDEAASPQTGVANTMDEPIEILSSDDEDEEKAEEDKDEDQEGPKGDVEAEALTRSPDSEAAPPEEKPIHAPTGIAATQQGDQDEEEEEEEEVEPERPAGTHIRFESYHPDMLTPPKSFRASSQSASRAALDSTSMPATSPTASRLGQTSMQGGEMDVEEEEEEVEINENDPPAPLAVSAQETLAQDPTDSRETIETASASPPQAQTDPAVLVDERVQETIVVEIAEADEAIEVDEHYQVEIEEPVSRGPSMPLVTPAVELSLDAAFAGADQPEAGIEDIMRAIVGEPDVVVEADGEEHTAEVGPSTIEHEGEQVTLDTERPESSTLEQVEEDNPEAVDLVDLERSADVAHESALASAYLAPPSTEEPEAVAGEGITIVDDDMGFSGALDVPEVVAEPASRTDIEDTISVQDPPALPDPYAAPANTDNVMPDVPFHRSRTPSLIVEPPPNPPYPEIVVDRADERLPSPADMPRPEDPVPDTRIEVVKSLSPHHIRPTLDRAPSSMQVNVEEVEMMLDPGPNEDREETPVDFPDPSLPAPLTDMEAPIEPQDLSPRLEPRSASMEAIAPGEGEAPALGDVVGTAVSREESPVLFPEPGAAAPNTHMLSPLDVHRDLPLVIDSASDAAPSLVVEPPSEPVTGPPSLTGSIDDAPQPDHLTLPGQELAIEQDQQEPTSAVPTSSDSDVSSAMISADDAIVETDTGAEAAPSTPAPELTIPRSPLRHHHGSGRQTSVPPPAASRATRSHVRRSSAAPEALHPPVTRQNCHYRKLYLVEGDMSAVVLVPQCTLADHALLEEEHAEDRGEPTRAEESQARNQPISESHLRLHLALTARLHRIVGSGIFDEEGKTYLLHANDAALLPEVDDTSSYTTKAPVSSSSKSPARPRRSKRLSEAPSETSIKEESAPASRRGVSVGRTASPVVEEEVDMSATHNLRSRSEAPHDPEIALEVPDNAEEGSDTETEGDSEIVVERDIETVEEDRSDRTRTASPTPKAEEESGPSLRYSLRSKGESADLSTSAETGERTTTPARATRSKTRTVTPSASAEPQSMAAASQAITPMTTRRRARESVVGFEVSEDTAPTSSGRNKGKGKARAGDAEDTEGDEVVTPAKTKASGKKGKSRRDEAKYVPRDDGEESDSSTYIIPHDDEASAAGTSTSKKRKIRLSMSSGHDSPWQLDQPDSTESGSPSASRSERIKRRAVASKDEPDVPVPEGSEEKEEAKAAEPTRGWRRFLWPFSG